MPDVLGPNITLQKQLLVEGKTAKYFFLEAIRALGLSRQIEVQDFKGISELKDYLMVFKNLKEFRQRVTSLGIIRDAEERADSAFSSVRDSLSRAGLPVPNSMRVIVDEMPRVGVFILPDCGSPGMLETLCWNSLVSDSGQNRIVECVNNYFVCCDSARVRIRNSSKARVWAYLSIVGDKDPLVGRAAQAKIWNWNSPPFDHLRSFLRAL